MTDPTARLSKLFASATVQDDEQVYAAATAAVQANKTDVTAQKTRVVALLKLDRWQDVIRVLDDAGSAAQEDCRVEKAYALYKTGHLESALRLLEPLSLSDNRAARHLAAQVAYKKEEFGVANKLYNSLVADTPRLNESEDYDLLINSVAVLAQLEWSQSKPPAEPSQTSDATPDAFESIYNKACLALARGEFQDALDKLAESANLCLAAPDLSDNEKGTEMVNILIQQVYASTRLGNYAHAAKTAALVDLKEVDASTSVFHRINALIVQQNTEATNPHMANRVISSLPEIPAHDKVFGFQASKLEYSRHVADLLSQKPTAVGRAISKKLAETSSPTVSSGLNSLSAVGAAADCGLDAGKPTIKKLLQFQNSRPNDLGLLLTIVQLYCALGNSGAALKHVEAFCQRINGEKDESCRRFRYLPGLIALKVALLHQEGRQALIRRELSEAASYWIGHPDQAGASSLLKEAGIQLIHSSDPKDLAVAGSAFETLVRGSGADKIARAGFVASMATTNYAKAAPYMPGLDSVDKLADIINVEDLLHGGVVSFPSQLEKQRKRRAAADAPRLQRPAKKRRIRKLPKDYVEGKKMDPERWLPLRDRSTYKPRGKKGKARAAEATQGGVVKEDPGEVLELVGGAGAVKVEKTANRKKKKGKR